MVTLFRVRLAALAIILVAVSWSKPVAAAADDEACGYSHCQYCSSGPICWTEDEWPGCEDWTGCSFLDYCIRFLEPNVLKCQCDPCP